MDPKTLAAVEAYEDWKLDQMKVRDLETEAMQYIGVDGKRAMLCDWYWAHERKAPLGAVVTLNWWGFKDGDKPIRFMDEQEAQRWVTAEPEESCPKCDKIIQVGDWPWCNGSGDHGKARGGWRWGKGGGV